MIDTDQSATTVIRQRTRDAHTSVEATLSDRFFDTDEPDAADATFAMYEEWFDDGP